MGSFERFIQNRKSLQENFEVIYGEFEKTHGVSLEPIVIIKSLYVSYKYLTFDKSLFIEFFCFV